MIDLGQFIIAGLGVFGLAYAMARLEGPFGLFAAVRERAAAQRNWFERGVYCPICLSFWVSWVVALIAHPALDAALILHALGTFGVTTVLTLLLVR